MPVSDLLRLGHGQAMTSQQVADMALHEDRAARAARAKGDIEAALFHEQEADALCRLINERN